MTHHDASEFPDGVAAPVSRLYGGQRATVPQLPAAARPQAAKERETPQVRSLRFRPDGVHWDTRADGEHRCA